MRDAVGGTASLVIVMLFIVIALGYMAFNVNYTKAFRMKDKIISLYEDYNGSCGSACEDAIKDYADTLGYAADKSLTCETGYTRDQYQLFCSKEVIVQTSGDEDAVKDIKEKHYFKIVTKINLQIPIISNVFDFSMFYIRGDTKAFEKEG